MILLRGVLLRCTTCGWEVDKVGHKTIFKLLPFVTIANEKRLCAMLGYTHYEILFYFEDFRPNLTLKRL